VRGAAARLRAHRAPPAARTGTARRPDRRARAHAARLPRRAAAALAAASLAAVALPASASAHGLAGRTDLPVPSWLFAWAASIVLVLSFVGLAVLWQKPRLEEAQERAGLRIPRAVDVVLGAFAVAVFVLVVYAGLAGNQTATANIEPSFIYVIFWVGLVPVSAVLGNVFEWLSPWRALARAVAWVATRTKISHTTRPYPERLGHWPAAVGIVAFAWVELVLVNRDDPHLLAVLALAYVAVALAGMYRYGIREWCSHADPFGVYFGLFAAMSPLVRRGDRVYRRPLLSGLAHLDVGAGTVGLLCAIIGSTTFDGLTNGQAWTLLAPKLENLFSAAGATGSAELAGSVGLLFSIGLAATIYRVGVNGMSQLGATRMPGLSRRFVHSLVPIAFAYAMAHYFSYLIFQGQAIGYLASDPLGTGANLLGTARWTIDYKLLSSQDVWYVQTLLLVGGHAAGLALAHDRALVAFRDRRTATRSQYWMLAVMVGYTSLGLWLLSTINV
jgi:hypothetical protein